MENSSEPSNKAVDVTDFSYSKLNSEEQEFYKSAVNQSFFYRGHPTGFVVACITYYGIVKLYPLSTPNTKLLACLGTSILGSLIARDSYMQTIQHRALNELPPSSYLRQSIEKGLVFHSTLFKNLPMNEVSHKVKADF